jgi:hypothetical protein
MWRACCVLSYVKAIKPLPPTAAVSPAAASLFSRSAGVSLAAAGPVGRAVGELVMAVGNVVGAVLAQNSTSVTAVAGVAPAEPAAGRCRGSDPDADYANESAPVAKEKAGG